MTSARLTTWARSESACELAGPRSSFTILLVDTPVSLETTAKRAPTGISCSALRVTSFPRRFMRTARGPGAASKRCDGHNGWDKLYAERDGDLGSVRRLTAVSKPAVNSAVIQPVCERVSVVCASSDAANYQRIAARETRRCCQ